MFKSELKRELEIAQLDSIYWKDLYFKRGGVIRRMSRELANAEFEKNLLKDRLDKAAKDLTISRKNLLASENNRKRDQMYFTSHAERDLAEARREISLLRDLVTSQGAIISEVFNR